MTKSNSIESLLTDKNTAAVVVRQRLQPVEGENTVVFPPTYATVGYNIDKLRCEHTETTGRDDKSRNPPNVCLMDSVGSQANRMEPIFKVAPYNELVPQILVEVECKNKGQTKWTEEINLLDAGHRICDAIVRFSALAPEIDKAFQDAKKNNMLTLARLAPTSLVFGCWDSRNTGVKLPRIVRSTIRALNVHPMTRSAQYVPAMNYSEAGILSEEEAKKGSEQGFSHVPATGSLGGVWVGENGEIVRESVLSLSALNRLNAGSEAETLKLKKYILGLSLVAFTASQDALLRMGCELVADPQHPAVWETVDCQGNRKAFSITPEEALDFAKAAAKEFGVKSETKTVPFDPNAARASLKAKK